MKAITFLRAHRRVTAIVLLWLVFFVFWLIPNRAEGPVYFLVFSAFFVMFVASQLFWAGCVLNLGTRFIPGKPLRARLAVLATIACLLFLAYHLTSFLQRDESTHQTQRAIFFEALIGWWLVGSMAGFGLVMLLWTADRTTRAVTWLSRRANRAAP